MSRLFRWVFAGALVGSVALVVMLSLQVRDLRTRLAEAQRRMLFPRAGDVVPRFDAITLGGEAVRVGEGPPGSRQLLLVFNSACPICRETVPAWRRLDSLVAGVSGLSVLGWSQDPDSLSRAYVAEMGFAFPVVAPDLRWLRPYKVEGVPATLVVGDSGRVLYARSGALTPAAVDSAVVVAQGG
ncbi:MAG: redoxin family protein [Gemmatimonadales bacterium]